MRTPPPLRGVQIPYMPAKTNSKVIPSVLCTSYFEDTRFVQGAIHTPWGGGGEGGVTGSGKQPFFFPNVYHYAQFSTYLSKPYKSTGIF